MWHSLQKIESDWDSVDLSSARCGGGPSTDYPLGSGTWVGVCCGLPGKAVIRRRDGLRDPPPWLALPSSPLPAAQLIEAVAAFLSPESPHLCRWGQALGSSRTGFLLPFKQLDDLGLVACPL